MQTDYIRPNNIKVEVSRNIKQDAQLPKRDRATRYVSKFMLRVTSYQWELERFWNSESGLQGYSRALAMVPLDKPHTISY